MGIFYDWQQWQSDLGEGVGNRIVDTATGIANGACFLSSKYPNRYPFSSYTRGFLKSICGNTPTPLPEPEPPPFTGGQCDTLYTVFATITRRFGTNDPVTETRDLINIPGKIQGVVVRQRPSDTRIVEIAVFSSFNGGEPAIRTDTIGGVGVRAVLDSSRVERQDGLDDDCGSLPPGFAPDPEFDSGDLNQTTTVNNYNSAGDVISQDSYVTTFDGDSTNIFNSSVNLGGTTVDVDFGGISLFGGNTSNVTNNRGGGGGSLSEEAPGADGTEPEFVKNDEEEEELEEVEEKTKGIVWVLITITQFPLRGKTILQPSAQDNDYFAGYFYWLFEPSEVYAYELQAIRKVRTAFRAPKGIIGYRAYTVNDAKISVVQYVEKEDSD